MIRARARALAATERPAVLAAGAAACDTPAVTAPATDIVTAQEQGIATMRSLLGQ